MLPLLKSVADGREFKINELADGEQLANYMIDYNLGVAVQNIYESKKIDLDYFEEE